MPRMNGAGPEKDGEQIGRRLGKCKKISKDEALQKLGTGMGMRRQSGGGQGTGKRLKAGLNHITH